ncbi:MAG TPA: enoyl-CoA hydratase/isomerase family protein [Acidimicrobiales bacterium]|nr:enoyl-CoA hydratase/isomerase family protein [Acidimicrobiales bacterium]
MSPAPEGRGEETVTVSVDGDVAIVTLRRPPHNLLTAEALREVADALHGLSGRARAAVMASEGRSFCAGADFRSSDAPDPTDEGGFEGRTGAFYIQAARVYESPVPVVAAVQGPAIGAGFGLAMACDIRVVAAGGWFQANFVRLGIHPGFALSLVLPEVIGPARTTELFLTGRRVTADEALAIGLAHRVVPPGDDPVAAATEIATEIAAGAPLAVASTRATLRQGLGAAVRAAMRHELAEQTALAGTADAVEGVNAMLEGRSPRFEGR